MDLCFIHGKESGPHGSKYQKLKTVFGEVRSEDLQHMSLKARLETLEILWRDIPRMVIVGSSLGGLTALLYAERHPEQVAGMVLCAPAVHLPEAKGLKTVHPNTWVLQGTEDVIVPDHEVVQWCCTHGVSMIRVPDGHRLEGSHNILIQLVQKVLRSIPAGEL